MVDIVYIAYDGVSRRIAIDEGQDLRSAALAADIPGIDGDCGGAGACATCRVRIDPAWSARAGPPSDDEGEILELVADEAGHWRLSCQIAAHQGLDGLIVHTPDTQR